MNKIFTAKSMDEAKAMAAKEFDAPESEIRFEILEEPRRGLFGKIKGEARVNAAYEPTKAQVAAAYIKGILKGMEVDSSLTTKEIEGGALIEITGDGIGTVIGRRGETLDAIQYLASMVCNKSDKEYYRISVDSCGYREKRRETLEELAVKIAKSVQKNGRTSALEPMNPYERRIIHSAVATVEGVTSRSVGEEPYRKVIISSTVKRPERPIRDRKDSPRPGGPRKDAPRDRKDFKPREQGASSGSAPRSFDLKTSFEKEYKKPVPKPKPEDTMADSQLYGKIKVD